MLRTLTVPPSWHILRSTGQAGKSVLCPPGMATRRVRAFLLKNCNFPVFSSQREKSSDVLFARRWKSTLFPLYLALGQEETPASHTNMPIQKGYIKHSLKRIPKLEFSPSASFKGFLPFCIVSGTASPTLRNTFLFFFFSSLFLSNCVGCAVLWAERTYPSWPPLDLSHSIKRKKIKVWETPVRTCWEQCEVEQLVHGCCWCSLSLSSSGSWAVPASAMGVGRKGCIQLLSPVSESSLRSGSVRLW